MTQGPEQSVQGPEWVEATPDEWWNYADRVSVEVRFKEWAGADDADEVWWIECDGAAWSREWLTFQLAELAQLGVKAGLTGDVLFMLDSRDRRTEWGASGSVFEAVLTLAESQLSNATWAALGALSANLAARLKRKREADGWEDSELEWTDQRAGEAAVSAVLRSRDVSWEDLAVRSVEVRDDGVSVVEVYESTSGSTFTVQVKDQGNGVLVARVRKITHPGGS